MDEHFASARGMIHFDWDPMPELPAPEKRKAGKHMSGTKNFFWRKYMILIVGAALFTIWSVCLSGYVNYKANKNTEVAVRSAVKSERQNIFNVLGITEEQFTEMETAKLEGKPTVLTGQESREAYITREINAVAEVIAKLGTDQQKQTEASCMLARVMSPDYPDTFEAVAKQPKQWMFYDGTDHNCSQHDKDIAESIVRPYLEDGIYPNGLTAKMVYGSWSQNDFVLRDSYEGTGTMNTWRYQG